MDDSVRRAMARWPSVPGAYHWLALDRRGGWLLDGRPIRHPRTVAFIARNYFVDEAGRACFQNGPQPVYVQLAYTPWIYHLAADADPTRPGSLVTHTGLAAEEIHGAWVDENGALLVTTEHGPGLIDDRDLQSVVDALRTADGEVPDDDALASAMEGLTEGAGEASGLSLRYGDALIPVGSIRSYEAPARLGFDPDPRPPGDD